MTEPATNPRERQQYLDKVFGEGNWHAHEAKDGTLAFHHNDYCGLSNVEKENDRLKRMLRSIKLDVEAVIGEEKRPAQIQTGQEA